MLSEALRSSLSRCLSSDRILTARVELERYGQDWTRQHVPAPSAVVLPESVDEVQAVVRWAHDRSVALVPSGGRTGLSGGAVAARGEVVVSLERMHQVIGFDPVDRTLTVQAGVTTQKVQQEARDLGFYYPVDFASRGSSQIGGNVATNAGGIRVLRHGMTRDYVTGVKVVTGTGEVLELNRGLVKNATGYDLRHLFVGSEGTLGIIVEVSLRLIEAPPEQQVMVLAVPGGTELMALFAMLRQRLQLGAFEFFTDRALTHVVANGVQRPFETTAPLYVLAEFDADPTAVLETFEAATDEGLVLDGVLSHSSARAEQLWQLRERITESIARRTPYRNDISVRVSRVPNLLAEVDALMAREYPDFEVIWFGHIGDGNLHISVLKPEAMASEEFTAECGRVTEILFKVVGSLEGSISAEHGIGLVKKPYLGQSRSAAEIELMRGIRRVFDPKGILNPGKLV